MANFGCLIVIVCLVKWKYQWMLCFKPFSNQFAEEWVPDSIHNYCQSRVSYKTAKKKFQRVNLWTFFRDAKQT